jgi:hypothetical protein
VSVVGFRTPNNSVAPSFVRRAVVNSWANQLIPGIQLHNLEILSSGMGPTSM